MIAKTPAPPYYAVIFTSVRTKDDDEGYQEMAEWMERLAKEQPGYLGFESAREETGISVSYWKDPDSIKKWKSHLDHQVAQNQGRNTWYQSYQVRIALVERDYCFERD